MNDYLRQRGVLEDTFLSYGGEFGNPQDITTIASRLNRIPDKVQRDPNWPAVTEIMWIPIRGVSNELIQWIARPLPKYGESKFVAPTGSNGTVWIPRETYEVAKHASVPLIITEGPIKGMILAQAGAHPIAPVGVWSVTVKDAQGEEDHSDSDVTRVKLHPAFQCFQLFNRKVFLAFDADRTQNPHVRHSEIRAWMALFTAGADVYQLCTWKLEDGKGIDDYISHRCGSDPAKQNEIYNDLFEKAVPFIETLKDSDSKMVTSELHRTQDNRVQFELLRTKLARALKIPKDSFGDFQYLGTDDTSVVTIPPTAKPWDEAVDAEEVLDEICDLIRRFEWLKPSQCRAVALWIVLTYLHDAVDILPILLITSPEENCGKTTLLKLVFYLSNRPIPAANISAAAIYRTIKDIAPTMTLDEADTYLQDNEEMRGVIDSGHEREFAWVIRTAMEGEDTVNFSTWCPKALAMIGLPKRTILSRSIHVRLDRKSADDKTEKLKRKHYAEFADLRRKISRLANDIREQVRIFESDLLENRAGDNWQPLLAIANTAGYEWVTESSKAAYQISKKDVQDSKSIGRYLLESLDRIISERRNEKSDPAQGELGVNGDQQRMFLPTSELLEKLNRDDEAPWSEDKNGKKAELSPHRLGKLLKKYEVESGEPQISGERARGYWADDLEKAIQKYAQGGI